MPARVVKQDREIKELFRTKIREKIERERKELRDRIDSRVPSWISWAIKPIADIDFRLKQSRNESRGESGETSASLHFWLLLPSSWTVINDVVLEPEPDEFAQIDHVLLGPPGIFLIETKTWEGAFLAHKDEWKRKEGNSWVRCESPTKQNLRHKRLFVEWLKGLEFALPEEYVFPVVLFTRCRWLKAENCSMPVFQDGLGLVWHLRRCAREKAVLSADQIDAIVQALIKTKPLSAHFGVERIEKVKTTKGKECVRVLGPKEKAELIRKMYTARGRKVSTLFPDKHEDGWWCFFV